MQVAALAACVQPSQGRVTALTAPVYIRSILESSATASWLSVEMIEREERTEPTAVQIRPRSVALEVCIMATVIEPETEKGTQPQPVPQAPAEPDIFAAELAMENRSHNFLPMLLVAGLVLVVGGTIFYFVKGARDVLTVPVATTTVNNILKAQAPATVRFSTGTVVSSVNEKPEDPHYKLLAKAGVITTAKAKTATSLIVTLTGPGEKLLSNINGVQKGKNPDGTTSYTVPLAERQLVSVDKVTMVKPHLAQVDYTWKWLPNRLGKEFDASGSLVKSFTTWDRATLIKSYGVDFYGADPTKASIVVVEATDGTWKPYTE